MKKLLLVLIAFMTVNLVNAQGAKVQSKEKPAKHIALTGKKVKRVPDTVSSAFLKEFSNATINQWYRKDGLYRVSYSINGQHHIAVYNAEGQRMD